MTKKTKLVSKFFKAKPKMAKTMRTIAKDVYKSNAEVKYHDTDFALASVGTAGLNHYLCAIPTGDSNQERIGTQIRGYRLEIKGTIRKVDPASQLPVEIRVIVWRDNNTGGANGTITNILEASMTASPTIQQYDQPNMKRFKILMDRRYILDAQHENRRKMFNFTYNKPLIIEFDSAGTASYSKGQVNISYISSTSTAGEEPEVSITSRLYFRDS
jgi:hypothetical protein